MRRRPATIALAGLLGACALSACGSSNDKQSATAGNPNLQQALAAHEWLLESADSSQPVTLAFGTGTVTGTAPCNEYHGGFTVKGESAIVISALGATLRACPPETMRAEQRYLAALEGTHDVDLSADRLVLTGKAGERLAYKAIDPASEIVGTWKVTDVYRDNGIHSMIAGTEPTLTFKDDGTVTLETGCNPAHGTYKLEGDRLTVGALSQTRMHCSEPPGVMDQEAALVHALSTASRVQVVPGTLKLLDDKGAIQLAGTK